MAEALSTNQQPRCIRLSKRLAETAPTVMNFEVSHATMFVVIGYRLAEVQEAVGGDKLGYIDM